MRVTSAQGIPGAVEETIDSTGGGVLGSAPVYIVTWRKVPMSLCQRPPPFVRNGIFRLLKGLAHIRCDLFIPVVMEGHICQSLESAKAGTRFPGPPWGGVQTRENWIAYPLQSAEDGVATRLQIREESASCLAAEYWSQEPAMRF
nr:putative uncharacterized protein LRRC75A-AS1, mitochondrial [Pan paniscus]